MIYNINAAIDELLEREVIDENTGETIYTPETLEALKLQLDEMITGFIDSISHEEARLEAVKREQERLKSLKEKNTSQNRACRDVYRDDSGHRQEME